MSVCSSSSAAGPSRFTTHTLLGSSAVVGVRRYHSNPIPHGRCGAVHVQQIAAPVATVWSLIRRFDRPQDYKSFICYCRIRVGDGGVGTIREVGVVSGLPAGTSVERLDVMDDESHVFGFTIIGGDHRLVNYRSTTSLHQCEAGTTVVQSYEVDVPSRSNGEDTCLFADTIVKCNLSSLAGAAERLAG